MTFAKILTDSRFDLTILSGVSESLQPRADDLLFINIRYLPNLELRWEKQFPRIELKKYIAEIESYWNEVLDVN